MPKPPIGTKLLTRNLHKVTLIKELGAGGQGTVYLADYDGEPKAFKWYHDSIFQNENKRELYFNNLCMNIENGAPSEDFLWPQDITEIRNGSFGYIMDLRESRYQELSVLLIGRKARFKNFRVRVDAMLKLVNAFRILHNQGYSYQDLNDGNFFFDPDTGDCLICDNDNAAYQGNNTGILGKQRYMAPEVVLGQKLPDKYTDRHSMAIILFMMLTHLHPLEGSSSTPPCMTSKYEKIYYGSRPIFIFDPQDDSNRPIRGIGDYARTIWEQLPDYVQAAFIRSFSKEAMTFKDSAYEAPRLVMREWIDVLVRFRNEICSCSACPNEEFLSTVPACCSACGTDLGIQNQLKLDKYMVPLFAGVRIFRCQLCECSDAEALIPVLDVIAAEKAGRYYIVNNSEAAWHCITSQGAQRTLEHGEKMPVKAGIRVKISGTSFHGQFEIV